MAQWLRAPTDLLVNLSSVPSTHMKRLTVSYRSCSRASSVLFWPLKGTIFISSPYKSMHIYIVKWVGEIDPVAKSTGHSCKDPGSTLSSHMATHNIQF